MDSHKEKSIWAAILNFWFGDLKEGEVSPEELSRMWWAKDEKADENIRANFESDLKHAKALQMGELSAWYA